MPIHWLPDGEGIAILDQTALPERVLVRELRDLEGVEEAIRSLRVRGAPLIGITAAMGLAALARSAARGGTGSPRTEGSAAELARRVEEWCERLARARPTAVNLSWAIRRMRDTARRAAKHGGSAGQLAERLREEADAIRREDRDMCRRIGEHALELLGTGEGPTVMTHCNTGVLATGGIGTALAPIYLATERGRRVRVFADETRPLLQGSRLTAWELARAGVEVTVIADGAAGAVMARERPAAVLVGADRIAANGDVANKVGTYGLAVLARHHQVPFYVLAPTSTVDLETPTGAEIPIEERSPEEIRRGFGSVTAPAEARIWSPAFDVTPAELVTAIVTEQGVARASYGPALREAVEAAGRERARPGGGDRP